MVSKGQLREAMAEQLGSRGLTHDELVAALVADGRFGSAGVVERQVDEVLQRATSFGDVGDRLVSIPALLDGTSWTVKVDADDAAKGFVRVNPSLAPMGWWLIDADMQFVDASGRVLGALSTDGIMLDDHDTDVLFGPDGWLAEFAGGWATATVRGATLQLAHLAVPPPVGERQAAAMRAGFTDAAKRREVVLFDVCRLSTDDKSLSSGGGSRGSWAPSTSRVSSTQLTSSASRRTVTVVARAIHASAFSRSTTGRSVNTRTHERHPSS